MRPILLLTTLFLLVMVAAGIAVGRASSLQPSAAALGPCASSSPFPTPTLAPGRQKLPPVGSGYWHTEGTCVVDAYGRMVRIAALTWYGMDSSYWVPAGLDYQPYTEIMDKVKSLGYNTIRLSFSNELVETNPIITGNVKANPQLLGVHAMTLIDDIVAYAGKIGLKIILDDGRSAAARPSQINTLDEPLWYTAQFPDPAWINDWKSLAQRYLGNSTVIGFDLRNEPHTDGPGPWNVHAYLYQGATWGPYKGVDNPLTDWRLAAERAGNASLSVNPHLLMLIEGVQLYPDASRPNGIDNYFWSGILSPVRHYPVVLKVKHQIVYEAHDWGPWKWNMPWYRHMTYAGVTDVWHQHWTFLLDNPLASFAAPVWLGEFGTCTNNPQCVDVQRPNNQATWFHMLLRYLKAHPQVGWGFFALNGSNSKDHATDNGLLNPTWNGVSNPALQADLRGIQH